MWLFALLESKHHEFAGTAGKTIQAITSNLSLNSLVLNTTPEHLKLGEKTVSLTSITLQHGSETKLKRIVDSLKNTIQASSKRIRRDIANSQTQKEHN